jgi:microsomal dipeptidase-like Zn-dependent dipeptidase
VIILALEGAAGIIESDRELDEFGTQKGIRIITPLHLTDDALGGVALLHGYMGLASPWAWFQSFFSLRDPSQIRINPHGLKEFGKELITKMISRGVWIDLAHASDNSLQSMVPLLKSVSQPLLVTHTVLRKHHGAERGLSQQLIQEIRTANGFVGLMGSELMLRGTSPDETYCCPGATSDQCDGSLSALGVHYDELGHEIGTNRIALGSDINGGIPHLKPHCHFEGDDFKNGWWNIGQTSRVWKALKKVSKLKPVEDQDLIDQFLGQWDRVLGTRNQ